MKISMKKQVSGEFKEGVIWIYKLEEGARVVSLTLKVTAYFSTENHGGLYLSVPYHKA